MHARFTVISLKLAHNALQFMRRISLEQSAARCGTADKLRGRETDTAFAEAVERVLIESFIVPLFQDMRLRLLANAVEVLDYHKPGDWQQKLCEMDFAHDETAYTPTTPITGPSDAHPSRDAIRAVDAELRLHSDVSEEEQRHNRKMLLQLSRIAAGSGHVRWALLLSAVLDDMEMATRILTHHPTAFHVFNALSTSTHTSSLQGFVNMLCEKFSFPPPAGSPEVVHENTDTSHKLSKRKGEKKDIMREVRMGESVVVVENKEDKRVGVGNEEGCAVA